MIFPAIKAIAEKTLGYLSRIEADTLYDPIGSGSSAVATHVGLSDPHTQYILDTERAAANGVATLDATSHIPTEQIKWPMVADTIDVGEEVTVPANRQLIIAEQLTNNGTLINSGKVYLI